MNLDVGAGRGYAPPYAPPRQRKKIIITLDGTGNRFTGAYYTLHATTTTS